MAFVNRKYGNLISKIKENINNTLLTSISEMFIQADKTLLERAESADSNKDRARYFELMRDTRALKDVISADFIDANTASLRPFAETVAEKDSVKKRNESELSLVDQTEIEDMVLEEKGSSLVICLTDIFKSKKQDLTPFFGDPFFLTADKFFWKKFEQPQADPKGGGQEARNRRRGRREKLFSENGNLVNNGH